MSTLVTCFHYTSQAGSEWIVNERAGCFDKWLPTTGTCCNNDTHNIVLDAELLALTENVIPKYPFVQINVRLDKIEFDQQLVP